MLDPQPEGEDWFIGLYIGILIALPLAILEESSFDERMRRLPFTVAILAKSLIYVASLLAVFMSTGLVVGLLEGGAGRASSCERGGKSHTQPPPGSVPGGRTSPRPGECSRAPPV